MSDIPHARHLLQLARKHCIGSDTKRLITRAINLTFREQPKFRVKHDVDHPLTKREKRRANYLRYQRGMSLRLIAEALRTNSGRISSACNPEREKRRRNGHVHDAR